MRILKLVGSLVLLIAFYSQTATALTCSEAYKTSHLKQVLQNKTEQTKVLRSLPHQKLIKALYLLGPEGQSLFKGRGVDFHIQTYGVRDLIIEVTHFNFKEPMSDTTLGYQVQLLSLALYQAAREITVTYNQFNNVYIILPPLRKSLHEAVRDIGFNELGEQPIMKLTPKDII